MTIENDAYNVPAEILDRVAGGIEAYEDEHDIRIYSCRDFGGRAKNLAGPDSDVDAFFLFDQPAINYKRLGDEVESINSERNGIDFHGWSTRRFAEHLIDSNPTAIEFLQSELVYYEGDAAGSVLAKMETKAAEDFRRIALYGHYYSMAKQNYFKYIKDNGTTTEQTLNRVLVVIDAIIRADYIANNDILPPLDAEELSSEYDGGSANAYDVLITEKQEGNGDEIIGNNYGDEIESWFDDAEQFIENGALNYGDIDKSVGEEFIDKIDFMYPH